MKTPSGFCPLVNGNCNPDCRFLTKNPRTPEIITCLINNTFGVLTKIENQLFELNKFMRSDKK